MKMDVKCCIWEARAKADADQLGSCSAVTALGALGPLGCPQGISRPRKSSFIPWTALPRVQLEDMGKRFCIAVHTVRSHLAGFGYHSMRQASM